VPDSLQRIVARALAKDPAARFADCGAMADALVDARRRTTDPGRVRSQHVGGRVLAGARKRGAGAAAVGAAGSVALDEPAGWGRVVWSRTARRAPRQSVDGPPDDHQPPRWGPTPPRRPGQTVVARRPGDTRPGPLVSPRSRHNPPARRRAIGAVAAAFAVAGGAVAVGSLVGPGLGSGAHRTTIARTRVPDVRGMGIAAAQARLARNHLHARTIPVAWPGHAAGTVRSEARVANWLRKGSTVTLRVAEVPTWKTVTTFTGTSSPVFRIEGSRFRLLYSVRDEKSCTLWIFCSRTSVAVAKTSSGATVDSFALSDGEHQTQMFKTGRGSYQVKVDPASGDARWSFTVQDWY
jgi:hypothetical protein